LVAGGVLASALLLGASTTSALDRVAPGALLCDLRTHERGEELRQAQQRERQAYEINPGYSMFGSRELHRTMREGFRSLTFHPKRAPLVMADVSTGRLHVFDCATGRCSRQEVQVSALRACAAALQSRTCRFFAVRAGGQYRCTLDVGLNH
jgi:hypothetical protein